MTCKHGESNICCAQCDRDVIDWYEKAPAHAVKSYEATVSSYETIAREAGFDIMYQRTPTNIRKWLWISADRKQCDGLFETQEDAWKACCVENGLV
jgi:hypothetical protein